MSNFLQKTPSELYYYCHGCKKFHEMGGHKLVNRKLCFQCGKLSKNKTRIHHRDENSSTQICEECELIYDLT